MSLANFIFHKFIFALKSAFIFRQKLQNIGYLFLFLIVCQIARYSRGWVLRVTDVFSQTIAKLIQRYTLSKSSSFKALYVKEKLQTYIRSFHFAIRKLCDLNGKLCIYHEITSKFLRQRFNFASYFALNNVCLC